MTQQMGVGEFKAKCLGIIDEVNRQGGEIVLTKRGKPVARLVPAVAVVPKFFGWMAGTMEIHGDIVAPTGEKWDAER
jgi:prevent-host-death family protein